MNQLLGERIRELRMATNYTQEQVAEQTGISRQRYARIENGTNAITLELLSNIAKVLDVSVGDITRVLEEEPRISYRKEEGTPGDISQIHEMLDLFYANKHLYERLRRENE